MGRKRGRLGSWRGIAEGAGPQGGEEEDGPRFKGGRKERKKQEGGEVRAGPRESEKGAKQANWARPC